MTAVLEYLVAEALEVAGDITIKKKKKRITPRHVTLGFRDDQELNELVKHVTFAEGGVVPHIHPILTMKTKKAR